MSEVSILYQDQDLLVAYKPAGVDSQGAYGFADDMISVLKKLLVKKGEINPYIGVVHRLDKTVEGLLLYAHNARMTGVLSEMIAKHKIQKEYCALVHGIWTGDGTDGRSPEVLRDWIYTDRTVRNAGIAETEEEADRLHARRAVLTAANVSGREADIYEGWQQRLTSLQAIYEEQPAPHYTIRTEDALSGERTEEAVSAMHIDLGTGRYHQIRVQLAHRGFPILGDRRYGLQGAVDETFPYPALCAYRLCFHHPVTGEWMDFHL